MNELIKDIVNTPKLGIYFREIEDILTDERKKREEFHRNILDGDSAEFIYGEIVIHEPVMMAHGLFGQNLFTLIDTYAKANDIGAAFFEKIMISLTRNDYEPDICYFDKAKSLNFNPDQLRFPAPDFVAEVLSPSSIHRDRVIKFEDYEAHGVKEYWIVVPDDKAIEQYVLHKDKYELRQKSDNGLIKSEAVQGFEISIESVFDSRLNIKVLKEILLK